jgi:hypothetical protein
MADLSAKDLGDRVQPEVAAKVLGENAMAAYGLRSVPV